jgi:glycosyltransferase involved in cell wall biosynthesis
MTVNGLRSDDRSSPGAGFTLSENGRNILAGHIEIDPQHGSGDAGSPLVSCLMVTRDRPRLAARAIECFLAQSYPNRELIVIDGGESDELQQGIEAICYPPIKLHRERQGNRPVGELRNLAVEKAVGRYLCSWDDDDLYDPDRLSVQMAAISALGADACFLARLQLWWPARRTLAFSTRRMWEGTMVCAKEKMPPYPHLHRGEDPPVAYRLWRTARVVLLDEPRLYTYVFHGSNTIGESQFTQHCGAATQQWIGDSYTDRLAVLATRVPIDTDEPHPVQSADHAENLVAVDSMGRADN